MFLSRLLIEHGINHERYHTVSPGTVDHVRIRPESIVVAPLRHPKACWASWVGRETGTFEAFEQAWVHLDLIPAHFLPIDHPDRDLWLNRMSEALGVELKTDWSPRNEGPRGSVEQDFSLVMSLPLVTKFYGE